MTTRERRILVTLSIACTAALQMSAASSAEGPTIEPAGGGSAGFYWNPSAATIGAGGSVAFRSTSTVVPHGVRWTGGPEKPSCAGVPVEEERYDWSGSCSFAKAGSYSFVCTVHPTEMRGTITVASPGETPPPAPPPAEAVRESPLLGPASQALKISKHQRGASVGGSITLSQASSGGKLEVVVITRGSVAGRLRRSSLKPGRLSFSVPLNSGARASLRTRDKLSTTVQVIVEAPGQVALKLKRGVVLHV
jgi:plastocyanin